MSKFIDRPDEIRVVRGLLARNPVVAILGARQVGKSTLAREIVAGRKGTSVSFDLESPADLARLADPLLALEGLRGLVVLDEIQRMPELFPVLRVLADRTKRQARFLLLGSASPSLLRGSSESLAGRIAYHQLSGLSLTELGAGPLERLWLRGGFPRSVLARSEAASAEWRRNFISTFLERDLPQLGITIPGATIRRFWLMLAHRHGQIWRASEFARSLGVSEATVRRYLDLLADAYVVRLLKPWHENVAKRQVRAPKAYVADSGLVHTLLDLDSQRGLDAHPIIGSSWESFLIEQVTRILDARPDQCYFWATHGGAELDLLIAQGTRRLGFEFKRTSSPRISPSMRISLEDLHLDRLDVVHAGSETFPMSDRIRAVAASRLIDDL